jgi:hypothetical protein
MYSEVHDAHNPNNEEDMKRITKISIAMGILCFGSLYADGVGVFGSWWSTDEADDAYGAGVKARTTIGHGYGELRASYFEDISEDFALLDYELTVIPIDVAIGLQTDPSRDVMLYAGGGISYFFMDSNIGDGDDLAGVFAQAGSELKLNENTALFLEFMWRDIEARVTDDVDLVENRFEIGGPSVNLGIMLRW